MEIFKWRISDSRTASGEPRPRLVLANPAILHSTQFLDVNTSIASPGLLSGDSPCSVDDTVSMAPFLTTIEATDQKLHAEIIQRDFDRPRLAVQLLTATSSKKSELLMHQILRCKVVEGLTWATRNVQTIPIQQPPDFDVEFVDHDYMAYGINNWATTLGSFCEEMQESHVPTTETQFETRDKVLSSLLTKIKESATSRYHSTVVSNLCGAALGLRALLAVSSEGDIFARLDFLLFSQAGVISHRVTDRGEDADSSSVESPLPELVKGLL